MKYECEWFFHTYFRWFTLNKLEMDTVTELNKIRVRAKDGESEYPFLGLHVSATCTHVHFSKPQWRKIMFLSSYGWNRMKSSTFNKCLGPTQAGNKLRKLLFVNYFGRCQGYVTWQFDAKMDAMKMYRIFLCAFIFVILLNSQITDSKYIEGHLNTKEVCTF